MWFWKKKPKEEPAEQPSFTVRGGKPKTEEAEEEVKKPKKKKEEEAGNRWAALWLFIVILLLSLGFYLYGRGGIGAVLEDWQFGGSRTFTID